MTKQESREFAIEENRLSVRHLKIGERFSVVSMPEKVFELLKNRYCFMIDKPKNYHNNFWKISPSALVILRQ